MNCWFFFSHFRGYVDVQRHVKKCKVIKSFAGFSSNGDHRYGGIRPYHAARTTSSSRRGETICNFSDHRYRGTRPYQSTKQQFFEKDPVELATIGRGRYDYTTHPYRVYWLNPKVATPSTGRLCLYQASNHDLSTWRGKPEPKIFIFSLFLLLTPNQLHWIFKTVRFLFDSVHSIEPWSVSPPIPNLFSAKPCSSSCHYQPRLRSYYEFHQLNEHVRFWNLRRLFYRMCRGWS